MDKLTECPFCEAAEDPAKMAALYDELRSYPRSRELEFCQSGDWTLCFDRYGFYTAGHSTDCIILQIVHSWRRDKDASGQ